MTIVFLDHTTVAGGAELALAQVLRRPPAGVRPVVLVPRTGPGVYGGDPRISCLQVGPPQRPGASNVTGLRGYLRFVVEICRQAVAIRSSSAFRQADVAVANTSRAAVFGYLAQVGSRKRFVVHLRDAVQRDVLGVAGFYAMRLALRAADVVIANSDYTLSTVEQILPRTTRRYVIPSPVGVGVRTVPAARSGPIRRVGMVARIDPWKGHELLLRAFALTFAETAVELHLAGAAVFGEDQHLQNLKTVAIELGIADRVHFRGQISDVAAFIDDMDVCVQCSLRPEPLGQNVLQYLARRCPVVAAAAGGPMEWVVPGDNGLLFALGDVASLAAALRTVAADEELRQEMSTAAVRVMDDDTIADLTYGALRENFGSDDRPAMIEAGSGGG